MVSKRKSGKKARHILSKSTMSKEDVSEISKRLDTLESKVDEYEHLQKQISFAQAADDLAKELKDNIIPKVWSLKGVDQWLDGKNSTQEAKDKATLYKKKLLELSKEQSIELEENGDLTFETISDFLTDIKKDRDVLCHNGFKVVNTAEMRECLNTLDDESKQHYTLVLDMLDFIREN